MAETMEQYMSKTRSDYGSGVARPKIKDKDNFELKGQFLKELRTNTFSGSNHEDANEHIEKEVILFYNGLGIPTRQILDSRGAIPSKTTADAKVAIQEMAEYSQKWHNGTSRSRSTETSDGLAAIQAQLNNLGREIKKVNEKVYAAQVGCEQCKGPHYTKDCPLKEEGKTLKEAYYTQFGGPFQGGGYKAAALGFYQRNNANPSYQERRQPMEDALTSTDAAIRNLGAWIKTLEIQIGQMSKLIRTRYAVWILPIRHIHWTVPYTDVRDKTNDDSISKSFKWTVKYPKGIAENILVVFLIKRVYMLSLRETMELDLEARLMGETLVINRSLDPLNGDYIELNDLNEPFELRRNQSDDLMPTIKEGEVIEEFRTRDDELNTGIDAYPSYCDYDKKIHIDCSHNLKFSCMIGFEFTYANFFLLLYVNVMSKKFHNSIMSDKMVCKGNNVVGALMNVLIFVGTYYVVTDFVVLENINAYRVRKAMLPFTMTIELKFKHHTNEHCNKIPPLIKINDEDKKNGISNPYQKLKGFYKGVLNLGPDYIQDVKME
ncbi:hypothetical protein Tco_0834754 [Tanacetum coccineum]